MTAVGQPPHDRCRLSLCARGHDGDLVGGQFARLADVYQHIIGNINIAQFAGDIDCIAHGAAGDG